jgi:hypothetical protein
MIKIDEKLPVRNVLISGSLNILEPSGHVMGLLYLYLYLTLGITPRSFLQTSLPNVVTHACYTPNPTQHLTFLYTSKPQTSVF